MKIRHQIYEVLQKVFRVINTQTKRLNPDTGILLPLMTLLLAILLLVSFVVPKMVIDTIKVNTTEEEGDVEYPLLLEEGTFLVHQMNTESRPLFGIQSALFKNGIQYEKSILHCDVYEANTEIRLSSNQYQLSQGEDLQYIYIPFADYEACVGELEIRFWYENLDGEAAKPPSLLANGRVFNETRTFFAGEELPGTIKCMYVHTHATYPLVYDLRILLVVFLAASATVTWKTPFRKKEVHHE